MGDKTLITVGADLSFTSTGVVVWNGKEVVDWIRVQTSPDKPDEVRIALIAERLLTVCQTYEPDLTLIEDYAFGKVQGATRLGELGGVAKNKLWEEDILFGVVQPTRVKKHAGGGGFDKKQMIAAAQDVWPECPNVSDVADAYWIAVYAYDNYTAMVDLS